MVPMKEINKMDETPLWTKIQSSFKSGTIGLQLKSKKWKGRNTVKRNGCLAGLNPTTKPPADITFNFKAFLDQKTSNIDVIYVLELKN